MPPRQLVSRPQPSSVRMPLFGYLFGVGALLLALLFAADALLPPPTLTVGKPLQANIRVKSQVKGPEAVVFSGPTVDYGVTPSLAVTDFSARAVDAKTRALASASADDLRKAAPQPVKAGPQRARKHHARRAPAAQPPGDAWRAPAFNVVHNFRDQAQ